MKFNIIYRISSIRSLLWYVPVFMIAILGFAIYSSSLAFSVENEAVLEQESSLDISSEVMTANGGLDGEKQTYEKAGLLSKDNRRDGTALSAPVGAARGEAHVCNVTLSENKFLIESEGGQRAIQVEVAGPCDWDVPVDNTPWLEITKHGATSGGGTITCSVLPNETPFPRIAAITVASKVITIIQSAIGISYAANY
jgi:hypothetical protein